MATTTYPDDWVEVKGAVNFTQALRDGAHYTTNGQGKVTVRPYHVQEMIGRGYTLTDPDLETVAATAIARLPFITPADVAETIAKAATKKARDAEAAQAQAQASTTPAAGGADAGTTKATPARA